MTIRSQLERRAPFLSCQAESKFYAKQRAHMAIDTLAPCHASMPRRQKAGGCTVAVLQRGRKSPVDDAPTLFVTDLPAHVLCSTKAEEVLSFIGKHMS